ncbi:hypothetical protein QFC19_003029 [Naganishia cerealis]|uniref:Uncharacterized protein n=1 Tax=Naganishia cerealis TaxID=610337 RepID=A0ACC2W517_9TREE|nr:hypothetical protein QFC19_003029 [Naganishia cerealis]
MVSKLSISTLSLAFLPVAIRAHIALWDEAMFGWNDDPNQVEPAYPLADMTFDDWWLHGKEYRNRPPKADKFMELPSGGVYHGYTSCNKQQSKYGTIASEANATIYACKSSTDNPGDGIGAMHTSDVWANPNPKGVKGTSIAIAYESDINKVQPESFSVISVNYTSPWFQQTDYHIPNDLPACPSARIANKCHYPTDTSNCTIGAKQPHYWLQKERNNNYQGYHDPPFYNDEYGFMDGAQTDLFANVADAQKILETSSAAVNAESSSSSTASTAWASSDAVPTSIKTSDMKVSLTSAVPSASNSPSSYDLAYSTATMILTSDSSAVTATAVSTQSSSNSANSGGRICKGRRTRGTLRRRRIHRRPSGDEVIENDKRMFGRPAIPDLRVGIVASPSVQFDNVNVGFARDFKPESRRAIEAAGLRSMQDSRRSRASAHTVLRRSVVAGSH